jgi:hypothetical protein
VTTRVASIRRIAAAATFTLLVVGCTTEEQSAPGPTLTSTTSPTTTTVPPATTSTVSPTTQPAESTTTASTTTTVPAGPADAIVPLLIGGTSGWLFLGAWQQDRWQEATDPSGNPIRPGIEAGTSFVVSNLDGETPVTIGENTEACFDERVGPTIDVDIVPPDPPGYGYNAVAVLSQPWPLKPRPVAVTSTSPDAYQAIGEAAFAEEPVDATAGAIEQVVVADLDGDGDDEALASFEFVQPSAGPGAPGDLAALLLIDVDTRAADTVLLSAVDQDVADDGSFQLIERYRVLDVADLNGDGRMEVLVHAWYYEGAAVIVHTYDGTELTEVLATGCGA